MEATMHRDDIVMLLERGSEPTRTFLEALNRREEELQKISTSRFSLGEKVAPHTRERLEPPHDREPFQRRR